MNKIFIILALLITFPVLAQYQNIKMNNSSSTDPEEVSIAINPKNINQMAGGANIRYFYSSTNAGTSWTQKNMTSTLGVWGDPCLLYDGLGNLYYAHLSDPVSGYWIDRIVVQRSTDNGATWNDGAGIGYRYPKEQDKEWLAVDMSSDSPYKNTLYVTWTEFDSYGSSSSADSSRILFSKSTDLGTTWVTPVVVSDRSGNCIDEDNTTEGAVPCVGPNGEVYVSWAGPLGILFDKSTNGGSTFGQDIFVSDMPGGWDFAVPGINRCNGMPITACDTSNSIYRGNIYILWGDQRNGTSNTDVFFKKSTDGGQTWTGFKKVNNDNTDRHQFFPWMTIDQSTGFIYAIFYDRRATTGSATDVYMAVSRDGGETFENIKISQSSFTPSASVFFGDYTNIAAVNRTIRPIWMRLDNSTLSVYTAIIYDSANVASAPVLAQPANNSNNLPQIVTCSWIPVSGATGYHIQIATDAAFNGIVFQDSLITGFSSQSPQLSSFTKYYWRVRAKNGVQYGIWSQIWNFVVGSSCTDISLTNNWNLLSLPLQTANNTVPVIFPQASSPAYIFANGYQQVNTLTPGAGFWIKSPVSSTVTVCGEQTAPQNISVTEGWNLIGPFHSTISTGQISSTPAGIVNSFIYGYQGNYAITANLVPGRGYWLKASQAGTVHLNATGKGNAGQLTIPEDWKKLMVKDAAGSTGTLYFTEASFHPAVQAMPPMPPAEAFDARYATDLVVAQGTGQHTISIRGYVNPVTISSELFSFEVFDAKSNSLLGSINPEQPFSVNLDGNMSLNIRRIDHPVSCELLQNYPNPFNPATTIGFYLPSAGKVSLKVYNVLGEEVASLFDSWKEAGMHEVDFNGSGLNSGMYIYRLQFNQINISKRMALIK